MRKFINTLVGDVVVYGGMILVGFFAGVLTSGKIVAWSAASGVPKFLSWVEEHPEFLQKASAAENAEPASEETDET